jgi:hypothetical protein
LKDPRVGDIPQQPNHSKVKETFQNAQFPYKGQLTQPSVKRPSEIHHGQSPLWFSSRVVHEHIHPPCELCHEIDYGGLPERGRLGSGDEVDDTDQDDSFYRTGEGGQVESTGVVFFPTVGNSLNQIQFTNPVGEGLT